MRFPDESEDGLSEERWDPTRTTGFVRSSSMKLKAAAVYPMVSVPWAITTPSAPPFRAWAHSSAILFQ